MRLYAFTKTVFTTAEIPSSSLGLEPGVAACQCKKCIYALHPRRRSRFGCLATTKAGPVPAGSAFFVSLPRVRGGHASGAEQVFP